MSVALRGNLEDFGIADVFQLIGQQRKTGTLDFTTGGRSVQILFDRGAVVSAAPAGSKPHAALGEMLVRCGLLTRAKVEELQRESEASGQATSRLAVAHGWLTETEVQRIEDPLTRETIFDLLRWSEGSFDFHSEAAEHDRSFTTLLPAEQSLMDGMRMVDEWQSYEELVPSDDTVFQRAGDFEAYRQQLGGGAERAQAAERVFFLVDGRLAVRRIIDLSLLGTFDATRILADLRRAGAIEPLDSAMLRRLRRRSPGAGRRPLPWRATIAALVPMTLLLLAAGAARNAPESPVPDGARAIRRGGLAEARALYAERRVRNALATYRFARGSYPDDLRELEETGALPPGTLAAPSGRPYYYARRGGAALLLAPER